MRSQMGSAVLAAIPARDALRNVAEDFVRSAVGEFGVLQGIDAQAFKFAQQNDFVADGNARNAGHIDQRKIHRNAAHDGRIVFAHDHAAANTMRPSWAAFRWILRWSM